MPCASSFKPVWIALRLPNIETEPLTAAVNCAYCAAVGFLASILALIPETICCASSLAEAESCALNLALMPASCCALKTIPACFSASIIACAFALKSVVATT